jgi:hypothetical protein
MMNPAGSISHTHCSILIMVLSIWPKLQGFHWTASLCLRSLNGISHREADSNPLCLDRVGNVILILDLQIYVDVLRLRHSVNEW